MPSGRSCSLCGKPVKSLSGLGRHAHYCKARTSLGALTNKARILLAQQWAENAQNNTSPQPDTTINSSTTAQPEIFDADLLDYATDNATLEPAMPYTKDTLEAGRVPCQPGKLSTASRLRSVSFEETTGRKAGMPISSPPNTTTSQSNLPNPPFYPFDSKLDYALAMFFHQRQLTKGDVTAFFQDKRLSPIHELLGFHNADEWHAKLNSIPYGVPIENWKKATVSVPSPLTGVAPQTHELQYQDVETVIRFLLGHTPFKDNLTYCPVRLWNDSDSRVYTEMWTGDWWWEMQEKLPAGGTVVPLLIGIDKTVLTQHHGDLSAWPIYMTIGNLDSHTRCQQTRPSLTLIGFMPIMGGYERVLKAEAYHQVLRMIFKRKDNSHA
jgi:hypothetical protein